MFIDTVVWIDLLRGRNTRQTTALGRLLDLGEAAVSPVIVSEILQGTLRRSSHATSGTHMSATPISVSSQAFDTNQG